MVKWTRSGKGYVSGCGRFAILDVSLTSRPKWVLFDHGRCDAMHPAYCWSANADSLANAKARAERALRAGCGGNVPAV